jgi:hypothetical protein
MVESTQKCANKRRSIIAASNSCMSNEQMAVNAEVLNSWKEVAVYLGRGVRTVQRWELELGLPVRRPRGKSRSAVIALKPELDQWLTSTSRETSIHESFEISINRSLNENIIKKPHVRPPQAEALHSNTAVLLSRTQEVLGRSADLCAKSRKLSQEIRTLTVKLARKKRLEPTAVFIEQAEAAMPNS